MSGHCPTCSCRIRPRFAVDGLLLRRVADAFLAGGVGEVVEVTGRSISQAYRLVQRARAEGLLPVVTS